MNADAIFFGQPKTKMNIFLLEKKERKELLKLREFTWEDTSFSRPSNRSNDNDR